MEPEPTTICDQCGCKIPGGSADALCPACLLTLAIDLGEGDLGDRWESDEIQPPCNFGDYRLLEELGRGGMGCVFLAEQRDSGRQVALKMLVHKIDSHETRQRFFREGRLAASINHPNSLYLFGSEEVDGYPVITMEVASSGTLQDKLDSTGKFPVGDAVDAILDIIDGLEAASMAGILHRDVKPSNCFYGADGLIKVGDYGLSLSVKSPEDAFSLEMENVGGTPAYASPEQLNGESTDLRSDIYSVGATLYHLLSGKPPFGGQDVAEVVSNVLSGAPSVLMEDLPGVPPELQQVIRRCMHKNRNRRFEDYQSLRNALLQFSSQAMQPASIVQRLSAGWIDYLIAFFPPYAAMMLLVGSEALVVRPLVDPSFANARWYFLLGITGILYFTILEWCRGAGLGKYVKGLVVADQQSQRRPGFLQALARAIAALGSVEVIRLPMLLLLVGRGQWSALDTVLFTGITVFSGSLPIILALRSRSGLVLWDRISRTAVFHSPEGIQRPRLEVTSKAHTGSSTGMRMGPYAVDEAVIPGKWMSAWDPVLRREVWLIKEAGDRIPDARKKLSRPTRLRWVQQLALEDGKWDAYSVPPGLPLLAVLENPDAREWRCLRHVLSDVAQELWQGEADGTLPDKLALNHIWISSDWRVKILDTAFPIRRETASEYDSHSMGEKLQFLGEIGSYLDRRTLPVHARRFLQRIREREFDEMGKLADTLHTHLSKPVIVNRSLRMVSETMVPAYIGLSVLVGHYHDKSFAYFKDTVDIVILACLAGYALLQLAVLVGFRTSVGHTMFGLALVRGDDCVVSPRSLLLRYAITWGCLFVPVGLIKLLLAGPASTAVTLGLMGIWLAGVFSTLFQFPRNWLDSLTKVYVVRD